jgi:hypothetical protein
MEIVLDVFVRVLRSVVEPVFGWILRANWWMRLAILAFLLLILELIREVSTVPYWRIMAKDALVLYHANSLLTL